MSPRRSPAALNHGERLVFGPLVLERDGIMLQGKHLAWANLAHVEADHDGGDERSSSLSRYQRWGDADVRDLSIDGLGTT